MTNYKVCQQGDLVLNRMRAFQGAIGVSPVAGLVSPDYLVLRPRSGVSARYLHHAFRSSWFVGEMTSRIRGIGSVELGTVRTPRINAEDLLAIEVALPTADGQRRIAYFLDDQIARIDSIIAARRAQIALVVGARRAEVTNRLLEGGDLAGPATAAWYRNLPASCPIDRCVRPGRSSTVSTGRPHTWWPATRSSALAISLPRRLTSADVTASSTMLTTRTWRTLSGAAEWVTLSTAATRRAGTAALVTTDEPFTMGQDVCRITSARRSQRYLYYVLNFAVSPQLEAARVGSTFTRINIDEIKSLRVPVPRDSEQDRISNSVDRLIAEFDEVLATESRQITLMEELKRSLTTAAVTGEFDVPTADGSRVLR